MKNKIKFTIYALLGLFFSAQGQTNTARNVLFLGGIASTSQGWGYFKTNMQANGYNINALNPGPFGPYQPYFDPVATSADKMNGLLEDNNQTNVLGIGHDGGGIVLRKMANNLDTRLTGIILVGVPNQGSAVLKKMFPVSGFPSSEIDLLVDRLENLRSDLELCSYCGVMDMFKNFSEGVKLNATRYEEFVPKSNTLNGLGLPILPYAVFWGNANRDQFPLTRMLSSYTDAATGLYADFYYIQCILNKMEDQRQTIQFAQRYTLFSALTGLYPVNQAVQSITGPDGTVNNEKLDGVLLECRQKFDQAGNIQKTANILTSNHLLCDVLFNVWEGYWGLMVSDRYGGNGQLISARISPAPENCCPDCAATATEEEADACLAQCYNQNACMSTPVQQEFVIFSHKLHDGLYSKEEQLLAGAANTYELSQTNHFQEQFWLQNYQRYQWLFDGQNMAFKVPK